MRTFLRGKVTLLFMMLGLLVAIPAVALAAELVTAEVDVGTPATPNEISVEQGGSKALPISLTATGPISCAITSTNPAQAKVFKTYSFTKNATTNAVELSSTDLSDPVNFYSNGIAAGGPNCGTTWDTNNVVNATVSAAADVPTGTYTIALVDTNDPAYVAPTNEIPSDTAVSNPAASGGKLGDTTRTSIKVNVVPPPNTAPTKPGKPALATGFSTPNQGVFDLTWTASTDDGKPDPPKAITYRLEHKDANDPSYLLVSGAGSLSTNSYSFTSTSKEGEGTWTYQVQASDSALPSAFSDASSAIKVDRTAPSAPVANTTPASAVFDGWFKDTVTVTYSGSTDGNLPDGSAGSGVASPSGYSGPDTFSTPSGTHNYSGTATDGAGNVSDPVTGSVKVDANNPTFGDCQGGPFLVNSGSHDVSITATDAHSGMDNAGSDLSDSVNTTSTGPQTVTFTAKDNVGHSVTKDCTYTVRAYDFVGFSSPVDNQPTMNSAKAGQAIPLKWRLMDNGTPVTNLQSVTVTASSLTCSLGSTTDLLEEYASGSSGLQNLGDGYYQFNWKTPTTYAKSCKSVQINGEGMKLTATQQPWFQFTK